MGTSGSYTYWKSHWVSEKLGVIYTKEELTRLKLHDNLNVIYKKLELIASESK